MASLLDRLDRELRAAAQPRDAARYAAALEHARSMREKPAEEPTGPLGQVTPAWLPAGDYEQAVQLWPELAGSELGRV